MSEPAPSAGPEALRCATHPDVETYLRCGKCDRPICPRCLVQTPVGARCRDCAQLRRLPMYDVKPRFLLRGALAALATAAAGSVLLLFLPGGFGLFTLLLGPLLGLAVAAVVGKATNEKRGTSLAWTSVAMLVVGFGLGRALLVFLIGASALPMDARVARSLTTGFGADPLTLILVGIAAIFLYNRLR